MTQFMACPRLVEIPERRTRPISLPLPHKSRPDQVPTGRLRAAAFSNTFCVPLAAADTEALAHLDLHLILVSPALQIWISWKCNRLHSLSPAHGVSRISLPPATQYGQDKTLFSFGYPSTQQAHPQQHNRNDIQLYATLGSAKIVHMMHLGLKSKPYRRPSSAGT